MYKIRNLITEDFYIGSTHQSFYLRWYSWRRELNLGKGSIHLRRAWQKYGSENFSFEILEEISDKDTVRDKEQYYIDTLNPTYNIRKDCKSSMRAATEEETKEKQSNSMKEKLKDPILREVYRNNALEAQKKIDRTSFISTRKGMKFREKYCPICNEEVARPKPGEYRKTCGKQECLETLRFQNGSLPKKRSESSNHKGKRSIRPCPICNKQRKECYTSSGKFNKYQITCGNLECINQLKREAHQTMEFKEKISNARKGKSLSEEHKLKLSEAHKGKKLSKEHKRNVSLALTGKSKRKKSNETV